MGPRAGTVAFNSLVMGQLLHTLSCRSDHDTIFSGKLPPNRMLNLAVGGSIAVQILAMLIPGLRAILGMTPMGLADLAVVAGTSLLPLLINESTKIQAAATEIVK
jgi:Ca2+-transporting ATPase